MDPTDLLASTPEQTRIGMYRGEPIIDVPANLYIPPEALQVMLDSFEGPLDLLLFLIRKQNLDVLDIPMADLTSQYMIYVDSMKAHNLELAAEYLLMAAVLTEIKSRMLLPRSPIEGEDDELDPRAELVRRLIEYERMKKASVRLEEHPMVDRDFYQASVFFEKSNYVSPPRVAPEDLRAAWVSIITRAKNHRHHTISREELSVREHMSQILRKLKDQQFFRFDELFNTDKGVQYVVVSFLAILELAKDTTIELSQHGVFSTIYVRLSNGV